MLGGPAPAAAVDACRLWVRRETDVPQVVAAAHRFCTGLGLTPLLAAHVATAASELANNLWMHSRQGGQVQLRRCDGGGRIGIELLAEDDGPGIADLSLAMTEGYSSCGSLGCGLPGVQRLMDEFHIDSVPGAGTRVRALKWGPRSTGAGARLGHGA